MKIQIAVAAIFSSISKNVNIGRLDEDISIFAQIWWENASWHAETKKQNQKLIRVTSSINVGNKSGLFSEDIDLHVDVWIKFSTTVEHQTINMSECDKFT